MISKRMSWGRFDQIVGLRYFTSEILLNSGRAGCGLIWESAVGKLRESECELLSMAHMM